MKALLQAIHKHPQYLRVMEWGKLLSVTGSVQLVVQAIGMISGILVVRLLPTHEYALYTLVNTMLGTMAILADGGLSTGIMAEGGKVWQDPQKLGEVLVTGHRLRRKFALGSLVVAIPVLFILLRHHGASWLMSLLIIASLIPTFCATFSATMLEVVPKLKQDILPLQKIQVGVNIGRLGILGLTLFVFPWAFVAVMSAGIPQILGNKRLKQIAGVYANWHQPQSIAVQKELLHIVKRLLPTAIYYCLSGQITIWLLSVFGSTESVAQIGALGRLMMLLSIFNIMFATLITPRFARLPGEAGLLLKRYLQIQAMVVLLCMCIVGAIWTFDGEVLWILGNQYAGLKIELLLNVLGSCLSLMAAISFALYTSRGWVIKPLISIPINIATITVAALCLNVSSLQGILALNIITAFVQVVMNVCFSLYKMKSCRFATSLAK